MESSLRERLERLIEHAASKTPCGEHYKCLLADLKDLLASQEQPSGVGEPRNEHELLVGGIVRAALELAILRGDLRMDNGAAFEEMSESEREDVITDTWNAMNGEGTCDDEPIKELTAIYAALAREVGEGLREALVAKWDASAFEIRWHENWTANLKPGVRPLRYDAKKEFHRAIYAAGVAAALAAPAPKLELTSRDCICPTTCDGPEYNLKILPNCPWHSRAPKPAPPAPHSEAKAVHTKVGGADNGKT